MRPTSAPRRFARLLPLLAALLTGLLVVAACSGDSDETAPSATLVQILANDTARAIGPTPIPVRKQEVTLRMVVRFADNTGLRGYTVRMAPEFSTTNPADALLTFTLNQDTLTGTSRTINLSLNSTTATMSSGTFRLTVTCRDAAGNVSAEAVQRFSVN